MTGIDAMKVSRSGTPSGSVASALNQLRELILNGELPPGLQIRQEEMAGILGISRVPLREVLRVLATEGLLTHRTHQGYFVTRLSPADLKQISQLLDFLETELIRTVRWPDRDEVAQLRELNREFGTAAAAGELATGNRLNREFHVQIFRLSNQEIYLAEAERFWILSDPYRLMHVATTDPAIAVDEHDQLLDALLAQDRALCLRVLTQHRASTSIAALSVLGRAAARQERGRDERIV